MRAVHDWEELHGAFHAALKRRVGELPYRSWFHDLRVVRLEKGELVLSISDFFRRRRLLGPERPHLEEAASEVLGVRVRLSLRLLPPVPPAGAGTRVPRESREFLVDDANLMAHASVQRVLRDPGGPLNPLVLHGPAGAGKSLLLDTLRSAWPAGRAGAVGWTAEELVRSVSLAARRGELRAYDPVREAGLVVVDETHRLAGRKGTQRALERFLGRGLETGQQFVIASRHHPGTLRAFLPRLRSLLLQGMVVELRPPRAATLLRAVQRGCRRAVPEEAARVALRLAGGRIEAARRLLEDAEVEARVARVPFDAPFVESLFVAPREPPADRAALAEDLVADALAVPVAELHGRSRARSLLRARSVAIFVLRETLAPSYAELGRRFGGLRPAAVAAQARRGREEVARARLADLVARVREAVESGS